MPNRNVHTVHTEKGWANKFEKSSRNIGYYDTKTEAQAAGRITAMKNNSEHIIHGLNGRIQNKNSYGNDNCPPREKK